MRVWTDTEGSPILQCLKEHFNISRGLAIIERSKDYCRFYYFGSSSENSSSIDNIVNHLDLLYRFIFYFKDKANTIINNAEKKPIILPNLAVREPKRNCMEKVIDEFIRETPINHFYIEDEGKMLAFTKREMSDKLFISPRTIEGHIDKIKQKLQCRRKQDVIIKLLNHNTEMLNG